MSGFIIEDAIRFFVSGYPQERLKKPSLFHSIRVCSYLYLHGYGVDICIAGLMHDALEDTSIDQESLQTMYGDWVLGAVQANTKNISLPKADMLTDIVSRCTMHSEGALIVKSADVLDNFAYYKRIQREGSDIADDELRRCQNIAKMIIDILPATYNDPIFDAISELIQPHS